MKIYDRSGFPNPSRIRIVLAQKGLESQVVFESVDLIGAEHKGAAFLAKNPSGVLPLLELDDGTYIAESTAITEYLDNLDGNPVLTGKTAKEKGLIHMMQRRAESELLDAVGIYFHHATPGLGEELQRYKSPEWAHRQQWGERERDKAIKGMHYFDEVLRQHPFVAGDSFSMADITVFAGLAFAAAAGIALDEKLTALRDWHARVAELPAVKHRSGQQFEAEDLRRLGF